jgi:hypothetical protein
MLETEEPDRWVSTVSLHRREKWRKFGRLGLLPLSQNVENNRFGATTQKRKRGSDVTSVGRVCLEIR